MVHNHDIAKTAQPIGIDHTAGGNGLDGAAFRGAQHNTAPQTAVRPFRAKTPQDVVAGYRIGVALAQTFEAACGFAANRWRSEEHTSELQSLMRPPYAVFCLK